MCLIKKYKEWRAHRRAVIYEGPYADGGEPPIDGGVRLKSDKNAERIITSRELLSFKCRFSALSLIDEDALDRCVYTFTAEKNDGGALCSYKCTGETDTAREEQRDSSVLEAVADLLVKYRVAEYNGKYYSVSGLPNFYGSEVDASYASGETLSCYNNQDPFLPVDMIVELCRIFGIKINNEE